MPLRSDRLYYPNDTLTGTAWDTVNADDEAQWKLVVFFFIPFHVGLILAEWNLQIAYILKLFFQIEKINDISPNKESRKGWGMPMQVEAKVPPTMFFGLLPYKGPINRLGFRGGLDPQH